MLDWIEEEPVTNRPEDRKQRPGPPRLWVYTLPGGHRVMAGRTDVDNDRLSLKVAGPNDWWFHVRGMPGSHVVLMAAEDRIPDRSTLNRAAAIAAYHSKARSGGWVPERRRAMSPNPVAPSPAPCRFVKNGFLKSGRRCLKFIEPMAWTTDGHGHR